MSVAIPIWGPRSRKYRGAGNHGLPFGSEGEEESKRRTAREFFPDLYGGVSPSFF
ncbi:MAG: hypothetical protein WAU17_13920 [Nitrospirales bacterium]